MSRKHYDVCENCGMTRGEHNSLNRATGDCCRSFSKAERLAKPPLEAAEDYTESWSNGAEDRVRYNLGNGGRRVPARGSGC